MGKWHGDCPVSQGGESRRPAAAKRAGGRVGQSPDVQLPGGRTVNHQGGASVLLWVIALTLFFLWLVALKTLPVSIYVHLPLVAANLVMLLGVIRDRRVAQAALSPGEK